MIIVRSDSVFRSVFTKYFKRSYGPGLGQLLITYQGEDFPAHLLGVGNVFIGWTIITIILTSVGQFVDNTHITGSTPISQFVALLVRILSDLYVGGNNRRTNKERIKNE